MSAGETKGVMHVILHMSLMRVAERQFSNLKPINQEIGRMAIHIGRREILCTLASAAVAWPLAARAQQQPVRSLIGILSPLSAASAARNIAAFRSGLRDLGYLEGRNATLEIRYGDGASERMAPLAQELVALKPDVLVAGARSSVLAAQAATRTIPMVIITVDDPGETISGMLGHAPGRTSAGTGRHSCGHPRRSALGRRHRLFR